MDTKTLQTLSKEELIKIVEELQLQIALQSKGIPNMEVDYKHLVDAASDCIFVLDENGNVVYFNSAWKELAPYNIEEVIGMHYSNIVSPSEIERASDAFSAVMSGKKEFHNEKFKTVDPNNNVIYFIANFTPVKSPEGKIIGILGILRKITEIHLLEKKLKDNSRRLEEKVKEQIEQAEELKRLKALNDEIINNAPIGIFTMDPTGIILSENNAIKEIIGFEQDKSITGINFTELPGFIKSEFQKTIDEVILYKKNRILKNMTFRPQASPDDERTLNLRFIPIFDNEKRVKSVMVMAEDVTEAAKIGRRMHRAEQLSAMGILAAGVAYEMKLPINLMTVDLNFIENNINETSPMRDYVKSMKDELIRMKSISEHLLNLSKPEETELEVFEIHKLITTHPIQIMLNRMQKNGYSITTQYPENGIKIKGIKNQLVQVLMHIITNAEEAMPDGGELRIAVESVQNSNGKFGVITIEDTGIGISQENIKKVFQPFFTTKGDKSTGLGLMVSYSIIENHGGILGIKSKPGEGTSIRIALPGILGQ